jgi:hypothetical protein
MIEHRCPVIVEAQSGNPSIRLYKLMSRVWIHEVIVSNQDSLTIISDMGITECPHCHTDPELTQTESPKVLPLPE